MALAIPPMSWPLLDRGCCRLSTGCQSTSIRLSLFLVRVSVGWVLCGAFFGEKSRDGSGGLVSTMMSTHAHRLTTPTTDEAHKAKNLINPDTPLKPTKTGLAVLMLQQALPSAHVVYSSATGASNPQHLGYMVRLGTHGFNNMVDMCNLLSEYVVLCGRALGISCGGQSQFTCVSTTRPC